MTTIIDVCSYDVDDSNEIVTQRFVSAMSKDRLLNVIEDDVLNFAGDTVWFPESEVNNILEYLETATK